MQSNIICSMQNPIIKTVLQLQKKKSTRKKENLFIVEGLRSVNEIPATYTVKYYITTPYLNKEQIPALDEKKWVIVTEEVYQAISDTVTPQGAMAVIEIPCVKLNDLRPEKEGFYLVLENIQDPGNLGTMIRTAHAFGAKAILMTKGCVDLYSSKVVRATMGSLFHISVCIDYETEDYMHYLQEQEIPVYATTLEEAKPIFHIDFNSRMAIVIGNEGNGVSDYVKKAANYKMMIPMPGASESLNASVAASICMYEVMRQMTVRTAPIL